MKMVIEGNQPLVYDCGSGSLKAGYSGAIRPKIVLRNEVGRPRYNRLFGQQSHNNIYIGAQLERLRGVLHSNFPMQNSIITDWDDMEELWKYAYVELDANPKEHPVLLTEAPLSSHLQRVKSAQIFFENFFVPGLCFASQAVLNLYASGRTTGLVVGCGEGTTFSVPIYEGFALSHAIVQSNVCGRNVDEQLRSDLRKSGHSFASSANPSVLRDIKESKCFVSSFGSAPIEIDDSFILPDGCVINIGTAAHTAPEILFHPISFGIEATGVHATVVQSIERADLELRLGLFENILLAGGTTMIPGFGGRLIDEIKSLVSATTKIRIYGPSDRIFSCWIGGSIISSMSSFQKVWLTKEEYNEIGESVFYRRGSI